MIRVLLFCQFLRVSTVEYKSQVAEMFTEYLYIIAFSRHDKIIKTFGDVWQLFADYYLAMFSEYVGSYF